MNTPKSRAQIQKEYRERKKMKDPDYMKRERERAQKNRVLIATMKPPQQDKQRARDREYARKYREKKKEERVERQKLLVQLNFRKPRKDKKVRKRVRSQALENARAVIRQLLKKQKALSTKCNTLARRMCRAKTRASVSNQRQEAEVPERRCPQTPKSEAQRFLRTMGISPKKTVNPLVRKLIMADIIASESTSTKRNFNRVAAGKVMKKYGLLRYAQSHYGIPRRQPRRKEDKHIKADHLHKCVISFLERTTADAYQARQT